MEDRRSSAVDKVAWALYPIFLVTHPFSHLLFLSALFAVSVFGKTTRFEFRDAGLRNTVHFIADAPLERTVGLSSALTGWMELDPEKLDAGAKGEFQVDVRTFFTGIETKSEYLRERLLRAPEFPIATFRLDKVSGFSKPRWEEGVAVECQADGELKMRGVSSKQAVKLELTPYKESPDTKRRLPGNLVRLVGSFDVSPAAFQMLPGAEFKLRFPTIVKVSVAAVGSDRVAAPVPSPGIATSNGQ